jgi:hypothetical protein
VGQIQVVPAAPLGADDAAHASGDKDQGAVGIRERSDRAGVPSDFAHESIEGVVGTQALPVFRGKPKTPKGCSAIDRFRL